MAFEPGLTKCKTPFLSRINWQISWPTSQILKRRFVSWKDWIRFLNLKFPIIIWLLLTLFLKRCFPTLKPSIKSFLSSEDQILLIRHRNWLWYSHKALQRHDCVNKSPQMCVWDTHLIKASTESTVDLLGMHTFPKKILQVWCLFLYLTPLLCDKSASHMRGVA